MGAFRKFRKIAAAVRDSLNTNEASGDQNRRTVHFETLESRVLLSGDTLIPPLAVHAAVIAPPLVDTIHGVPYVEPAAAATPVATPPDAVISAPSAIQSGA